MGQSTARGTTNGKHCASIAFLVRASRRQCGPLLRGRFDRVAVPTAPRPKTVYPSDRLCCDRWDQPADDCEHVAARRVCI